MKLVTRVQSLTEVVKRHLSQAGVFDDPSLMAEEYDYETTEAFARNAASWSKLAEETLNAGNCLVFNHGYGEVKVVWLGHAGIVTSRMFYLPKQVDKIEEVMFMS